MRHHHGRPRAAWPSAIVALLFLFAVAWVSSGCSGQRLPMAPAARGTDLQQQTAITSGSRKETVVITVAEDQDAVAVAATYGATLVGNGWRVAGLKPGIGQSADDLLCAVSRDQRVLTAEMNSLVESAETRQKSWAFDDGWGSAEACEYQPATASCNLQPALLVSRGQGVLVAVLDTGAELTHPWIQSRVAGGWDFVDGDADPTDAADGIDNDWDGDVDEGWGHGTHVAGTIGIAAPDAGLLMVRVLDSDGRGDMMGVAQAIRWSVANGAKVINMSLGGPVKSDAVKLALDEAYAAGVVGVAAAGNWGASTPVEFPACYRQTIGVAAIDADDRLASFSSYGSYVGICAPGVAIRSSYRNGGYALWSGTSMAAPWVSGGAALLFSKHHDWSRGQVSDRLETTGRPIWKMNPTLRLSLGGGALDLGAALDVPPGRSANSQQ